MKAAGSAELRIACGTFSCELEAMYRLAVIIEHSAGYHVKHNETHAVTLIAATSCHGQHGKTLSCRTQ